MKSKTAWLNLRYTSDTRAAIFKDGLARLGYRVDYGLQHTPGNQDILITWNRIGAGHNVAKIFERNGLKVLIAENASWGNAFAGQRWYHMARNFHNSQGRFYIGEDARFDRLGIDLKPWRITPGETIILPQRGIGTDPIRMPNGFARKAVKRHGGRVRRHPGKRKTLSLEDDLVACSKVITWGSGAAIKALRMGIPCISYMPNWIGEQDNTDQDRLRMFRELAWAQWRHKEIENGTAFDYLLNFERGSGAV